MIMAPVDGNALMPANMQQQQSNMVDRIPLSHLMDFIIQRTYHELSVLSELLPRKTDMERKIEIVQFASRTRQLFVRLLALVKWANSASKVDKCAMISNFLDQQALLFVDTADRLARLSRETLTRARLPSFSLPCAIDVLTTGTYPRLPACIKDKIVPPDHITHTEKWHTLMRLSQIIEHRLVTSDLPVHMHRPIIKNGRVRFIVQYEFEVTLTLMGDEANVPWRLLDIEILVGDPETGDGKALVHPLQVNYLHQLVQSRLVDNDRPLHDLYNCLHSFCQSLRLEVLHSQTQSLVRHRLGEHVSIEEYHTGCSLVLSYWKDPVKKENKTHQPTSYKLSVHMDERCAEKPLQVSHLPEMHGAEMNNVAQAIRSDHLSIERLLIHTIHVRSLAKLKDLQRELQLIIPGPCKVSDLPTVLYLPVLYPCTESEMVCIAVHMQRGTFLVSICDTEHDLANEIEERLNGDRRDLYKLFTRLRMWLGLCRCEKSIQHLQVRSCRHLPLVNTTAMDELGPHKLYVNLAKQPHHYLVVSASEGPHRSVEYRHFLLHVRPATLDEGPPPTGATGETVDLTEEIASAQQHQGPATTGATAPGAAKQAEAYVAINQLMEFDTYWCTHGPGSRVHDVETEEPNAASRKRKLLLKEMSDAGEKKEKRSPYIVPQMSHILAMCEERLPFTALASELLKQGILHQGVQIDGDATALCLTIVDVLSCAKLRGKPATSVLRKDLLSCKFRKGLRVWKVESILTNCVLSVSKEQAGPIKRVYFEYEFVALDAMSSVVTGLLDDWLAVVELYDLVCQFASVYKDNTALQAGIEVMSFTYKRLTLAYGHNKCYTVSVQYAPTEKCFRLSYSTCGAVNVSNCHTLLAGQLHALLNQSQSLARLAQVLLDTWSPLSAIAKLNTTPPLGFVLMNPSQPVPNFSVLAQSPTHIRLMLHCDYCLDIHCQSGGVVAIRDGAYSMFDTSKVVDGLTTITGLKAFLDKFVDETVTSGHRPPATAQDDQDNLPPPSPSPMDAMDFLPGGQVGSPGGGATGRGGKDAGGLRFHNSPMTPPSNPHTPSSPGSAHRLVQHPSPASSVGFPLASPPSMQHVVAPSPGSSVMAPSPGVPSAALHHVVPSPSSSTFDSSSSAGGQQAMGATSMHIPSPASQYINPQGILDNVGSPFGGAGAGTTAGGSSSQLAMPSPGNPAPSSRNWPGSPSVVTPGPSPSARGLQSPGTANHPSPQLKDEHRGIAVLSQRMLPQRSWAPSIRTLLSHDGFARMLSVEPPLGGGAASGSGQGHRFCCPLERFLCCVALRRHTQRTVMAKSDSLQQLPCNEPGMLLFKSDILNYCISLNLSTLQSLHLKVTPIPDNQIQWDPDDLQVLEKFYELKVVCAPYKPTALVSFERLLGAPRHVLRDCIQIMRLELMPDRSMKWAVQWCLTMPHRTPPMAPVGTPIIIIKTKILFVLQLTRIGVPLPVSGDSQTIVIPIIYDPKMNTTQMAEHMSASLPPTPARAAINSMFKRFADFNPSPADCSIFPAVRELLTNLVIPVSGLAQ